MASNENAEKDTANGSRRKRRRTQRMQQQRRGRVTKLMSFAGLALSIGTALYRFRRQWIPKVEEMSGEVRDRVAKATS